MLDRIAEFLIFGFAPLMIVILAAPDHSQAAERTISGKVVYRERIALPPNAVVTVRLADISLADAPAAIVSEQKITPRGQVPIPFELKFDTSSIQKKASYALQARITVDDKLMFINDEHYAVEPLSAESQTIMVRKVGGDDERTPIVGQTWSLQFIDGPGAVRTKATFQVDESGKVSGQGPCNRYFASATINGDEIKIGKAGATMMACEQKLMAEEKAFFAALEKVASFKIENGRLMLMSADGRDLLRFAASA